MKRIVVALALALAGCSSTPAGHHDGGAPDLATARGDLALLCSTPGRCTTGGNSGICCWRTIGPHEDVFCDPADCQLEHGVDTQQSPLCNTAADCYGAARTDLGTVYCCYDATYPPIKVCRFSPCSGTP